MASASDFLIAVVVVLVLFVIIGYVWYNNTGWTDFSYSQGQAVSFSAQPAPDGTMDTSKLRFKAAVFSVTPVGGTTATKDVTATLNSMAVGYAGTAGTPGNTGVLSLNSFLPEQGLTAFSFQIPGVNDKAAVPDNTAPAWTGAAVSLAGEVRTLP